MRWRAGALIASAAAVVGCGGSDEGSAGRDAARESAAEDVTEASVVVDAADGSVVDSGRPQDATVGAEAAFTEAPHALPVIPFNGGPVLAHPTLVTITYSDDPDRAYDEALGAFLVQSSWLATVGKEYGVGLGQQQVVELGPSPAQIDDAAIQALILSLIQSGTLPDLDGGAPVPSPDSFLDSGSEDAAPAEGGPVDAGLADGAASEAGFDGGAPGDAGAVDALDAQAEALLPPLVYMIYFPSATNVTVAGEALCQYSGGGYHYQIEQTLGGQTFAYAVISACPGQGAAHELLQAAASHELIEACTDPAWSGPAYALQDTTSPWSLFGGEVGDMCSFVAPAWSEGSYDALQRVYSNASAQDGGVPCVPSSGPYYATDVEPQSYVPVAAGQSTTFDVTGWSTAPVSDWVLTAVPYISSPSTFQPFVSVAASMLNNGQKTTLTVGIPVGTASQSYALVLLESSQSQNDYTASLVGVYVP